ncbi:MAG TPA: hypothetical protein VGM78_12020, partial [Ilumatobacteraceae bacterium]
MGLLRLASVTSIVAGLLVLPSTPVTAAASSPAGHPQPKVESAAQGLGTGSGYTPLTPARLLDTRPTDSVLGAG